MLTEFKRDNKQRDYERMSEDLNRRKRELKGYEDQLRSRTSDILQMDQTRLDDKVPFILNITYDEMSPSSTFYLTNDHLTLRNNCF
jgi:hypothetical protein